ncbi:hypothetical protein DAPK24_002740 [Pichia kluyveri]|uniref:Uncharacterized protein n=1 Tax=Pichia kluyveri TaxID=36015 RepID=A0AAV5QZ60_PICKL|nr:hypothetical protein DAPK24_002740 [Pichia kluyveri]
MLLLAYSPIVYYKSLSNHIGLEEDGSISNKGILQKIIGFVPNLMYNISTIILRSLMFFTKQLGFNFGIEKSNLNIKAFSAVMTYLFITFRKMIALLIAFYITLEDDDSTHTKGFTIFAIFTFMQMKFINDLTIKKFNHNNVSNDSLKNAFVKLYSVVTLSKITNDRSKSKIGRNLVELIRSRLFRVFIIFALFFVYYTFSSILETPDDDLIWRLNVKSLLILDSLFVTSLSAEMLDLSLSFKLKNNSIV